MRFQLSGSCLKICKQSYDECSKTRLLLNSSLEDNQICASVTIGVFDHFYRAIFPNDLFSCAYDYFKLKGMFMIPTRIWVDDGGGNRDV